MGEMLIQDTTFTEIADIIREHTNTTAKIKGSEMATEIRKLLAGTSPGTLDTALVENWYGWFRQGSNLATADYINTSGGKLFDYMCAEIVRSGDEKISTERLNEILVNLNFDKGETFLYFLSENTALTEITATLDMPRGQALSNFCRGCTNLLNAPVVNAPNGIYFDMMYYNCSAMKSGGTMDVSGVGKLNNQTDSLYYMYGNCTNMTDLTLKVNNLRTSAMSRMFHQASALTNLTINGNIIINSNSTTGLNLAYASKLTVESLINVLEALENPESETTQYSVAIGTANYNKLKAYIRPETITDENPDGLDYTADPEHVLTKTFAKNIQLS